MPRFAANLSMLFTEVDFPERFAMARAAGFEGVEYLFPYAYPKERLGQMLSDNQLTQVLFNLPPGNWDAGERGIACLPDRVEEFQAGVDQAIDYAKALGCRQLNCLAGLKPANVSDDIAWQTLVSNVAWAAGRLADEGMPSASLTIAIVFHETLLFPHAVLLAETDAGTWVLDNLQDELLCWDAVPYFYTRREQPDGSWARFVQP